MAEISKITLLNGTTYDLKDKQARDDISAIQAAIAGGVTFMGETSTALTDGSTTASIVINSATVTAVKGYLVVYQSKEFVFDGTKWIEMGDLSLIGDLGWKDSASGNYTPTGSVSQPTFSGNELTSTGTFTANGNVTLNTAASTSTGAVSYISAIGTKSFSGTAATIKPKVTAAGTVAISEGTGTANYTPAGSVSQPSFTGTAGNVSVSGTPTGTIAISKGTGTANYTPEGSVAAPTISVKTAGSTTTVNSITAVGTLPTLTTTVANEVLTIGFDQGTLPTKSADQTVKTGDAAYQATAPAFTGTGAELKGTFTGTSFSSTGTFTPAGTVSKPSFTGTGTELKATFTGTEVEGSASYTPAGSVTVNATTSYLTGTFSGTQGNVSVKGTPTGTVSKPTFTGTQGTVTVT